MSKKNSEVLEIRIKEVRIEAAKKAISVLKASKPSRNWRADVRRFMAIIEKEEEEAK